MWFKRWLVFDLGQVLVRFDTRAVIRRFEPFSALSHDELTEQVVHSPLVDRFERGLMDKHQFISGLATLAKLDPSQPLSLYESFYTDIFTPIDGMIERLRRLQRNRAYGLALLSNTNALHVDLLRRQIPTLFPLFDRVFLSMELGIRKPNPEIFRTVQRQLGVAPRHIRYWDDLPANVDGARRAGWEVRQFWDVSDITP